jgi:hypothetical protein
MIYILLKADHAPAADGQTMLGAITGVLAQHGALGTHETMHGDVDVQMHSAISVQHWEVGPVLQMLVFDDWCKSPRTPTLQAALDALFRISRMCDDGDLQSAPGIAERALEALAQEVTHAPLG